MHKGAAIPILALLLVSAVCVVEAKTSKNVQSYAIDLDLDGKRETIEVEDRFSTDAGFLLRIKSKNKSVIDNLFIPGKVRQLQLFDLNNDGRKYLIVYSDGPDNLSNLAIYQLKNNKLQKIFAVASEYGVDADFSAVPRIKAGRAPESANSPNFTPLWDVWVWVGDRFIKE